MTSVAGSRGGAPARDGILRGAMGDRFYTAFRLFGRFVTRQCLREFVLHRERSRRAGGYLLACTHVSHVEPMLISCLLDRHISWMARIEFFRVPALATLLRYTNSFCVNRQGVPVSAIRTAVRRATAGGIVGVFPEGGCRKGSDLVIRGGRIKQGICTIAMRAQVPIVPVVMLGTHKLNQIEAWLPGRYGQAWTAFGEPICPPPHPPRSQRRRARQEFSVQLERAFVSLYHELLAHSNLLDEMTP